MNHTHEYAISLATEFTSQNLVPDEVSKRASLIAGTSVSITKAKKAMRKLRKADLAINSWQEHHNFGRATLIHNNCFDWLQDQEENSIYSVVTDPPYGVQEYTEKEQAKLRAGRGGVWRLPPSYDGHQRSPLPRFTVLTQPQLDHINDFFFTWTKYLLPKLRPGANVIIASHPLLNQIVSTAATRAGLEKRGEIIRLVMTMRGGDRPKGAHQEFTNVTVMPRSMWEPWIVLRKPPEATIQENLRRWGTGGFRRLSENLPFGDVIHSAPTRKREKKIAPHPSLKPQAFLRELVRGVLPLGAGTVVDPFAGAGATLAAAEAVGYQSTGIEKDPAFFTMAKAAIEPLANLKLK